MSIHEAIQLLLNDGNLRNDEIIEQLSEMTACWEGNQTGSGGIAK